MIEIFQTKYEEHIYTCRTVPRTTPGGDSTVPWNSQYSVSAHQQQHPPQHLNAREMRMIS